MRHPRTDYDAIQPWPTKRPHHARLDGEVHTDIDVADLRKQERHEDEVEPLIPDDEPVFLLRAKDPSAPAALRAWAEDAETRGGDPEMVNHIREWADHMEDYRQDQYGAPRVADVPDGMLAAID